MLIVNINMAKMMQQGFQFDVSSDSGVNKRQFACFFNQTVSEISFVMDIFGTYKRFLLLKQMCILNIKVEIDGILLRRFNSKKSASDTV